MAGVDVGGGERRARNSEINMIPFIDLLMVTIAFLLITAVWVTNSRLKTSAEVPAAAGCGEECQKEPLKAMHVHVGDDSFRLVWKQGATVLSEATVPKHPVEIGTTGATAIRYTELSEAIQREWERSGEHRAPSDRRADQAVLHSDDRTPFRELVAVLDAINAPRRAVLLEDGRSAEMPAFLATFSAR
ncbi:ExbD/TolR family protein [Sorangium sp. So ce406]|uniref:ExbD/TolR family protein n=1 Tax=Sorangium sp. So ce406 TaxID=3133311 RepID=UPI003F5C030B